jgi:MoxR-like ATPase
VKYAEETFPDVESLRVAMDKADYLASSGLAVALFCAFKLNQPLLLEGEPGVGKKEAAKVFARILKTELIRLQCYEGIDLSEAVYEWNYPKQLLAIRVAEAEQHHIDDHDLFTEDFLIERPLLRALRHQGEMPSVLLVDEVDRSDDEFEAFLLELLGESTITIPELGTFRSDHPPVVILTSNRTRDLHDALKRRCIYHWITYPDLETTISILRRHIPEASTTLLSQSATAVNRIREISHLQKPPGMAETIDWVKALMLLGVDSIADSNPPVTWGSLVKYREDLEIVESVLRGTG